jgi:hypothetical protein
MSGDQGSNGSGGVEGWMPPREDINAPDLYIPSKRYIWSLPYKRSVEAHYVSRLTAMALVTYTLLAAFVSGSPEVLGICLSKSFAIVMFEFLCIRSVVSRVCSSLQIYIES